MKFGTSRTYSLICGGCGFNEFVQDNDYPHWRELGWKYEELRQKKITPDDFDQFVMELDLPELRETLRAAATWKCSCGESNPPNFEECWKCGAVSPVEAIELKNRPVDTGEWQHWKPQESPGGIVQSSPKPDAPPRES